MSATRKEDYIGKVITWEQAVELFPDMWVVFENQVMIMATFKEGNLKDVVEDKDIMEYKEKHWFDGLYIDRTTEASFGGYI